MDYQKLFQSKVSKANIVTVIHYVDNIPERFEELVNVFLKGPVRVTQNVSWVLSHCVEKHPSLIKKYLTKIIKAADQPDAVKRNVVRILQFVTIPEKAAGHCC